ncbi:MAG: NAD-dependent epimerase/dehydratase family protein [Alphaproteobacteria bacterium]|nr:NAD-dependent epimerase/dehydratase family protein [Alphaproteobacteria bacterium]
MRFLVTGSAGHLGEALVRTLKARGVAVTGLDRSASPFTDAVGSVSDRDFVREHVAGADVVLHAAALHKPHVATHSRQDFIDVNITGTLNLLEESLAADVRSFVFTSTTSVFGRALTVAEGEPAAWITEDVTPVPKNIYGVTKLAAEDLCSLFWSNQRLPCIVLRTSRFFPEDDDSKDVREAWSGENAKANEMLYRRADIADVVEAHLLAARRAPEIGFGKYIISATTPFRREDLAGLGVDAPSVLAQVAPAYAAVYRRRGWSMFPRIDRVYDNARARKELGWAPEHDFSTVIASLERGEDFSSDLSREIGAKGYHAETFAEGPYPVE